MAGINHVTGEWWWIPDTRGLKRGCPMKDGKIDNKNKTRHGKIQTKHPGRFNKHQ